MGSLLSLSMLPIILAAYQDPRYQHCGPVDVYIIPPEKILEFPPKNFLRILTWYEKDTKMNEHLYLFVLSDIAQLFAFLIFSSLFFSTLRKSISPMMVLPDTAFLRFSMVFAFDPS